MVIVLHFWHGSIADLLFGLLREDRRIAGDVLTWPRHYLKDAKNFSSFITE